MAGTAKNVARMFMFTIAKTTYGLLARLQDFLLELALVLTQPTYSVTGKFLLLVERVALECREEVGMLSFYLVGYSIYLAIYLCLFPQVQ